MSVDETVEDFDPFKWVAGVAVVAEAERPPEPVLFRSCWLGALADNEGNVEIDDDDNDRYVLFVNLLTSVGISLEPAKETT